MTAVPDEAKAERRPHRAARIEDAFHRRAVPRLRRKGWQATIVPYAGYGCPDWVRVMCKVVLARPETRRSKPAKLRGWRSFTSLPVRGARVTIDVAGRTHEARTDRAGFVNHVVNIEDCQERPRPGWATVHLSVDGADTVEAPVRIVDPTVQFGLISDVDDTVMVTALPRPLLAAWNTFVLDEHARMAVPGMAVLYERVVNTYPGAPVFYLSTGAWNVAPTLTRFLARHLYPAGPLLLTNWGPTNDRWFRSGREHKRATLARLATEFPHVRWLLVGDDGQHDKQLYAEFATAYPDHIAAVAIRHLSPTQSVLAGTMPWPADDSSHAGPAGRPWLYAPDGAGLWRLLREEGIV